MRASPLVIEMVGWTLICFVAAHWMGWWILPLGTGVGIVRGATR